LCADWLSYLIREGDRSEPNDIKYRTYKALDKKCAKIEIFQTNDGEAKYITDHDVTKCGTITLPVTSMNEIIVRMKFGSTSLKVQAEDKGSGKVIDLDIKIEMLTPVEPQAPKPLHVVFILDKSGSMENKDITPRSGIITSDGLQNRLGCVLESVYSTLSALPSNCQHSFSLIAFDGNPVLLFRRQQLRDKSTMISQMMRLVPAGGTDFIKAFTQAEALLKEEKAERRRIFFLTDGEADSPVAKVKQMISTFPDLHVWCSKFRKDDNNETMFREIAEVGNGQYATTLTPQALADFMHEFAIQELL